MKRVCTYLVLICVFATVFSPLAEQSKAVSPTDSEELVAYFEQEAREFGISRANSEAARSERNSSSQNPLIIEKKVITTIDLTSVTQEEMNDYLSLLEQSSVTSGSFEVLPNSNIIMVLLDTTDPSNDSQRLDSSNSNTIVSSVDREYKPSYSPNDLYYSQQWYLEKIKYSKAIDSGLGANSPVIAIIDNGLNTGHPEIANKLWTNLTTMHCKCIDCVCDCKSIS